MERARTFGLREPAVSKPWRGHGIARSLYATLLDGIQVERVLSNVHPGSEAASTVHRAWGSRKTSEARTRGTSADLHDVTLLDVP